MPEGGFSLRPAELGMHALRMKTGLTSCLWLNPFREKSFLKNRGRSQGRICQVYQEMLITCFFFLMVIEWKCLTCSTRVGQRDAPDHEPICEDQVGCS